MLLDRFGGPLVATMVVESNAPGCRQLTREVRVVDGASRVDLINTIDKTEIRDAESVHFGFAPHIPRGIMRMEIPWAIIRPEQDQLAGACKNYFTIGRWVDVANQEIDPEPGQRAPARQPARHLLDPPQYSVMNNPRSMFTASCPQSQSCKNRETTRLTFPK